MNKQSREDYLRAIYCLAEENDGAVRSVEIAKYLQVSKASVSEMLKRLTQQKQVKMAPYSKISLTHKGLQLAQKLTYKHRLCELFLKEVLKVKIKNDELHQEAHKLEHAISDEVAQKMAEMLEEPEACPCGRIIPNVS